MHLKNHNGFSFIEMMIALSLLSIMGSSLFLVQTSLFSKLLKTHINVSNIFELDKQILKFQQKLQFAIQQKQTPLGVTLHHENTNPIYTVDIKTKPITEGSTLFKEFGQDAAIVHATIKQDNLEQTVWFFTYTAIAEKNEAKETVPATPTIPPIAPQIAKEIPS